VNFDVFGVRADAALDVEVGIFTESEHSFTDAALDSRASRKLFTGRDMCVICANLGKFRDFMNLKA
jgi:hypothetical protein